MWNPPVATSSAKAPLALLIDDGFPAAGTWDARMRTADDLIARAETDNRGVALIPLSEPSRDISFETPAAARVRLKQIKPKPHAVERADTLPALGRFLAATPRRRGGLAHRRRRPRRRRGIRRGARQRARRPADHRGRGRHRGRRARWPRADNTAGALTVKVLRAATGGTPKPASCARSISRACRSATPPSRSSRTSARPTPSSTLPVEIRNDIARLEIAGERSAGAVQLLDKRWRRRTVGVVTGSTADTAQPLLASTYYLSRALSPFADVRLAERGSPAQAVSQFIEQRLPMMILADVGNVAAKRASSSRAGSRTAACWCASPARGSPPATTTSCR